LATEAEEEKRAREADPANAVETGVPEALEKLFEVAVLLADAMDQGLAERGLTRARAELLWRLEEHQRQQGAAMTQRELSQVLKCTPRNVTGLVDVLQADGLVARGPHPTDRRATLVTLTERGRAASAMMRSEYQRLGGILFADLAGSDLSGFATVLDRVLARLGGNDGTPDPAVIGGEEQS
jgi:DNA-binding MarR family transcriptional regulator